MSIPACLSLQACLRLRSTVAREIISLSTSVRYASITSAIGQGIRKSRALESSRKEGFSRHRRSPKSRISEDGVHAATETSRDARFKFDEKDFIKTGRLRAPPWKHHRGSMKSFRSERSSQSSFYPKGRGAKEKWNEGDGLEFPISEWKTFKEGRKKKRKGDAVQLGGTRVKEHVKVPDSIPYTTPASQFVYGMSAVEAAIRCARRQLYKLYIYQSVDEGLSPTKAVVHKLALLRGLQVKMAYGGWDRLLDKMSAGRPHNGCVLEASPLPNLPVTSLEPVDITTDHRHFSVTLDIQSREEAAVNGTNNRIPMITSFNRSLPSQDSVRVPTRYPFVLLLDGILDPGNLGAIIRSAYYLGVDAIIFAGRNSAPLSPVTIKASAGAAENMTLLSAGSEVEFIRRSRSNGWRFYAADAPSNFDDHTSTITSTNNSSEAKQSPSLHYDDQPSQPASPLGLLNTPTVLMLGSESTGLASHLKAQADSIVSIPRARHPRSDTSLTDPARVDSLNVSVAAALLIEMFLRVPITVKDVPQIRSNSGSSQRHFQGRKENEDETGQQSSWSFASN